MISEKETVLFGIPIPSDNKVFLTIIVIHIVLGMMCVVSGLVAMLSSKYHPTHPKAGKVYFAGIVLIFISVVPLSIMRWPHNNNLLILGTLSFMSAYTGKKLANFKSPKRSRLHTVCMGLSYIFLLTAFYVDNGKNLPFWRQFSTMFFYIFPAAVGLPIIVYFFFKHPLNKLR